MTTLKVGPSLKDTDVLWRYLSLDKFIDLVESNTLFFAPLASYSKTDPFEGYAPRAAIDALASISKKYRDQHIESINQLDGHISLNVPPQVLQKIKLQLHQLRDSAESMVPTMRDTFKNIAACTMVNCWYKNDHESEGMWGLYSKGGVAIKTSVEALRHALNRGDETPVIHIGSIKYLDFSDPNLKPADCVTEDGQLIGMIKRIAYEHEKEVRMYIARERPERSLEMLTPEPTRVPVNVQSMLESVVISPFAGETIERSVRAVCRWSGLNGSIVSRSSLLDNCDFLLDVYT